MAITCPPTTIDFPKRNSEHRFGLFSASEDFTSSLPGPYWEECGIEWLSDSCSADAGVWINSCDNLSPMTGGLQQTLGLKSANPFLLYSRWECAAIGRSPQEHEAAALSGLSCAEQRTVESYFYDNYLVTPDTIALNSVVTPISLAGGIGLLEGSMLAQQCNEVTLHLPRELGALAARFHQTFGSGTVLRSALGSPFVFGVGYDNVAPDGTPAPQGVAWIYATAPVFYARTNPYLNPPTFADALNRTTNEVFWWAQRKYLLAIDSCVTMAVAVTVDGS